MGAFASAFGLEAALGGLGWQRATEADSASAKSRNPQHLQKTTHSRLGRLLRLSEVDVHGVLFSTRPREQHQSKLSHFDSKRQRLRDSPAGVRPTPHATWKRLGASSFDNASCQFLHVLPFLEDVVEMLVSCCMDDSNVYTVQYTWFLISAAIFALCPLSETTFAKRDDVVIVTASSVRSSARTSQASPS